MSGATLSPAFAAATTSYHAVVANSVSQGTITETTSESTATVEYLDDSDATLTDADTMTAGLQVNLSVGTNIVKVKVTAPDTTTTETYTVNVFRVAVPATCSAASMTNRIWTGNLTVGQAAGSFRGYSPTYGSLDDTTFTFSGNDYTIDVATVFPGVNLVFSLAITQTLGTDADDLVLHVGTEQYALSDATYGSSTNSYEWTSNVPSWADGNAVCLALTVVPPEVSSVALTSAPGSDNTYAIGDAVEATVTFDAAVDITGTPPPQLELDFDGTAKAAACATGTSTTTMVCSYTVVAGDTAPNGVRIAANTLTGGTIYATGSTTITADRDHTAVAIDTGHTVDGIRPTLVTTSPDAPTTSTDGETVLLVFSEDIGAVSHSDITIQANNVNLSTTMASVAGTKVELTLTTALTDSTATLTVALAADAVEDTATNGILAVAATGVTNAIIANEPPEFSSPTATREVPENTAANTNIGAALPAATDGDNDPLTYTLEDTDAASFGFNAATRQLSTKSGITYDHETTPSYSVTLKADDDNGGSDTLAVTITVTDVEEPPGRPAAPSVSSVDGNTTSLEVNWTAPSNTGPDIDNYDLRYREGTSGAWTNGPRNVSGASATIPGLTESTSYQVQVLARNAEGDSPWSLPGSGQTGALGAPDVPHSLDATPGNRQVMLSWVQPSGGAEVTDYEYEQDFSGTWISTGSTATSYTVTGLTNGQSYTFRVRAANSAGASAASAASPSVTPATVPGAPTSLSATVSDQRVDLIWTAPASNGGQSITDYEYEQGGSGTWISTGGTATSYMVRNLTNGQPYRFRVRAVNSVGAGAASAASPNVTPATEPDAPTGLSATVSDQEVDLIWTAPASNGGATILRYEYELDFSGTWTSTGGTATSYTVTGLTNGQSYTFRVRAVNRVGAGAGDQFAVGHADIHGGGAGHAVEPQRHARQPAGDAQLGPAIRRRGAHALRIRAGRVRDLDLHGRKGPQLHGDRPDQRSDVHVPGAGGQQRRAERGLRFAVGHAHDHGAGGSPEPELHARRRAGDAALEGARQRRRGADHALRVRAGRVRDLDLHGRDGHQPHGDRPEQRPGVHVPGAGGQRPGQWCCGDARSHAISVIRQRWRRPTPNGAVRAQEPDGGRRGRRGRADLGRSEGRRRFRDQGLRVPHRREGTLDIHRLHRHHPYAHRSRQRHGLRLRGSGGEPDRQGPGFQPGRGHAGSAGSVCPGLCAFRQWDRHHLRDGARECVPPSDPARNLLLRSRGPSH